MDSFKERQRAAESMFATDQMAEFKTIAKRNRLLGKWAAEKLGKLGEEAEHYGQTVVAADLEEPGDEDLVRKILSDFEAAGLNLDAAAIRSAISECDSTVRLAEDR